MFTILKIVSGEKHQLLWIIGSSYVHYAELAARSEPLDLSMWRVSVKWFGRKGLTIDRLDSLMDSLSQESPEPDWILIHCGSNDITTEGSTGKDVLDRLQLSVLRYQALFSTAKLIWSSMLQRRYWHFAPLGTGTKIESKRSRINRAMKNFILANNGKFINNDSYINVKDVSLYYIDGTHLSNLGNSVLLRNWLAALQSFLSAPATSCYCSSTTEQ